MHYLHFLSIIRRFWLARSAESFHISIMLIQFFSLNRGNVCQLPTNFQLFYLLNNISDSARDVTWGWDHPPFAFTTLKKFVVRHCERETLPPGKWLGISIEFEVMWIIIFSFFFVFLRRTSSSFPKKHKKGNKISREEKLKEI